LAACDRRDDVTAAVDDGDVDHVALAQLEVDHRLVGRAVADR
jgi:hypothetical protein